jgi:N-formylglutamate deformylase
LALRSEQAVSIQRPPSGRAVPVVFSSPHSGRLYPPDFRPSAPVEDLVGFEDRLVDDLLVDAPGRGATLVAALFPRAYIDPNRAEDDLDRSMVDESWTRSLNPTENAARGIGLIFGRLQDGKAIYDRPLQPAEVDLRLARYWRPFHAALKEALDWAVDRWGAVWHVDWHSMRPVGDALAPDPGRRRPDFVVSDLDGASAEPAFTARVTESLRRLGHSVTINDPFKGGYIVERSGRPAERRHSLQVEINRGLYIDPTTLEPSEGFARLRATLDAVAADVADYAAERLAAKR